MFVAVDGSPAGLVGVADPIKESTPEARFARCTTEGIRIVMLTGDSRTTAEAVAKKLGIDEVDGRGACPTRRPKRSKTLPGEGRIVAMAGDGSTTRPRWLRPRSASPWAPAPTSPWRAPASRWSRATSRGIVRARRLSRRRWRTSSRTCSSRSSTTPRRSDRGRGALPVLRAAPEPDDRRRRDELQLGVGDQQRAAAPRTPTVTRFGLRRLRAATAFCATPHT